MLLLMFLELLIFITNLFISEYSFDYIISLDIFFHMKKTK